MSEQEALNAPINPTGAGEDPAVKALLSPEFETMPNLEALDVALMLQQIIRQQDSILSKIEAGDQRVADQLVRMKARMDEFEQAARAWERDREKFMERVLAKGEQYRIADPEQRARFQAEQMQALRNAHSEAAANLRASRKTLEARLKEEPKETVISPGVPVVYREGDVMGKVRLDPEIVSIGHLHFRLPPGKQVKVPKSVAERLRERRIEEEEQRQRKELLSAKRNSTMRQDTVVAQKWHEINATEGFSSADPIRVGSTA